jgi:signal transduction histidine kinase
MLQNWPIRSKLVVILVVPLVALAVLSAIQVRGNADSVLAANRIEALADFSIEANDLVHAIQTERYASHTLIGSGYLTPTETVTSTRPAVDRAAAAYRAGATALPASAKSTLGDVLTSIDGRLGKLAAHRKLIDGREMTLDQNIVFFDGLVTDLLGLDARVAAGSRSAELVNGATTLVAIAQAKEAAAQQRGTVNRIFFLQQTDPAVVRQIEVAAGTEDAWLAQFRTTATAEQRRFYDATVAPVSANVAAIRDSVVQAAQTGQAQTADRNQWVTVSDSKVGKLHEVEREVAQDLAASSHKIASDATRQAIVSSVAVALILILSVLISLFVASPMIAQLRRLRRGALEVANVRLPDVVERLHRGEPVDLNQEHFPVTAATRDEIGQLAEAFATVHEVAVRTAVEQAAMRKSIGDTFLNLARRSQALIHRQLKVIDALERKETDPDELEELFRLDHLATRMRRHAEDLIVLSGSKPARGWRRPVPIKDLIRGAVAEVEDYTRVKVLPVGGGALSGHAVGDVIHMLAELIENATSFSPPHTPVQVTGHEVSNGFAVEIEDRGLGMNPAEFASLNDRLENPPPFDLSTSERLGLFVVGRLAERHGIKVRLRTSPYGGTMAIVLLPGALLRLPDSDQSTPSLDGAGDAETRELAAVGAGGPLALAAGGLDAGADHHDADHHDAGPDDADHHDAGPDGLGDSSAQGRSAAAEDPDPEPGPVPLAIAMPAADFPDPPTLMSPVPPVPPQLPPDESGPRPMFAAPAQRGDDEPLLDDLPVFATVRSSWFIADRQHRPGGEVPEDDPTWPTVLQGPLFDPLPSVANDVSPPASSLSPAPMTPTQEPSPSVAAAHRPPFQREPARGMAEGRPGVADHSRGGRGNPPAAAPPGPATSPLTPPAGYPRPPRSGPPAGGPAGTRGAASTFPTTEVGLPRRTRRENLAPELRRDSPARNRPPTVIAGTRSPDEVRAMMSSFQRNFGRGLADGHGSSDGDDQRKVT